MATAFKAQRALAPAMMRVDGNSVDITDKFVQAVALVINDTIDFKLPAGAVLTTLQFQNDASDTGSTLTVSIGYTPVNTASALAPNLTYFGTALTTFRTAGRQSLSFKPIKFQEDVYIRLTAAAAPTGITGTPEIWMIASINQEGPN